LEGCCRASPCCSLSGGGCGRGSWCCVVWTRWQRSADTCVYIELTWAAVLWLLCCCRCCRRVCRVCAVAVEESTRRLAALEGVDATAARLTAESQRLREKLEQAEGQVRALCVCLTHTLLCVCLPACSRAVVCPRHLLCPTSCRRGPPRCARQALKAHVWTVPSLQFQCELTQTLMDPKLPRFSP
jgi:hypothetical protein